MQDIEEIRKDFLSTSLRSKVPSNSYREGWDRVFNKSSEGPRTAANSSDQKNLENE